VPVDALPAPAARFGPEAEPPDLPDFEPPDFVAIKFLLSVVDAD
jgi:hypothetical protein